MPPSLRLAIATLFSLLALALPATAFEVQSHKTPNGHSFSLLQCARLGKRWCISSGAAAMATCPQKKAT